MKYHHLLLAVFLLTCLHASTNDQASPAKQIMAWDGETATVGAGWTNPEATCSIGPQTVEAHSGKTALEFRFKGTTGIWLDAGWDWAAMQVGPYGIDITGMKYFTFWLKVKGQVAELTFNLLCNGAPALDQPQHHTSKVVVSKYCPAWSDGEWHRVVVPLADLVQPEGFDARHVAEIQMFNTGNGDGCFFLDDLAFEDRDLGMLRN